MLAATHRVRARIARFVCFRPSAFFKTRKALTKLFYKYKSREMLDDYADRVSDEAVAIKS